MDDGPNKDRKISSTLPEMLHVDGDTLWIGETYETAAIIFTRQSFGGVVRGIFYNRADEQQRRCSTFMQLDPIAEWFAPALAVGEARTTQLETENAHLRNVIKCLRVPCEDALRHLSKDNYRTYATTWDALRAALTNALSALGGE